MKQRDGMPDQSEHVHDAPISAWSMQMPRQQEILRYITEIGASLRLHMDTATLMQQVADASCRALQFRYSVLYLADGSGYFRVCATSGGSVEEEEYLHQHPLPDDIVAQLLSAEYRISNSYFIPGEAPIWRNSYITSFFVVSDETATSYVQPHSYVPLETAWQPEDLMIVPLRSANNVLLGFLTPDAPLNGRRPTLETATLLELFANQAAVVIEGARLYEEARQSSEERAALIEIGRVLSSPESLHDLQTVYESIYEQVRRVMPADAFFVTRYFRATGRMIMDYLRDEGVLYPPVEYASAPSRMNKFLFEERVGYLFSTTQEYEDYVREDLVDIEADLIGEQKPSQSYLFAPIHYGDEPIGFLSAQSYQPYAYTRRHLEMLKEIGVQAGIAITNARLNTELREALKRAQESERMKNHFLMTASHELRTPLTAVQGYLELLENFGPALDDGTKSRFLTNARRACEELVLLLGNVMDTSRIDQDRVSLNFSNVQVSKAIRLILEILEPILVREQRPVEVNIPDDLSVWVDDLRLRQVLLNLVGNALKYTPPSTKIAITGRCLRQAELQKRLAFAHHPALPSADECYALIAVRDWGPGITPQDQQRLFTKFMRLDSAMNSEQRGAGLGLYLCRQLIEAMGGCIWIESQGIPGEGTTFALALRLPQN